MASHSAMGYYSTTSSYFWLRSTTSYNAQGSSSSRTHRNPYTNSNSSDKTQYTQNSENVRTKRQAGNPPEPVLANATTPLNPRHREPDPPRVTTSPLRQSYFPAGKSPLQHQGNNGGRGSHGNSRPGNSYEPVNLNNPSYPSPMPSKTSGSGILHEDLIENSTAARNTPSRNKKKPVEPVQYDDQLVPPFPSDGTDTNYLHGSAKTIHLPQPHQSYLILRDAIKAQH